jgi:hypothetical protein
MLDVEPLLIDELEALAPSETAIGDWNDVVRRAESRPGTAVARRTWSRRRLVLLLATALMGLLALGTAASAAFGWKVSPFWAWVNSYPPGRTSPIVTVFAGSDWTLVAWRSTSGLCTSYGAPGASGTGCSPLSQRPLEMMLEEDLSRSRVRIIGTVSASVARIEVIAPSGHSFAAKVSGAFRELRTTRHFFFAEGRVRVSVTPRGSAAQRFTLLAYDVHGKLLQHVP